MGGILSEVRLGPGPDSDLGETHCDEVWVAAGELRQFTGETNPGSGVPAMNARCKDFNI